MEKCKTNVHVKLIGTDGNIFAIIGNVNNALRKNGYQSLCKEFTHDIMSSNSYTEALCTVMKYVTVE